MTEVTGQKEPQHYLDAEGGLSRRVFPASLHKTVLSGGRVPSRVAWVNVEFVAASITLGIMTGKCFVAAAGGFSLLAVATTGLGQPAPPVAPPAAPSPEATTGEQPAAAPAETPPSSAEPVESSTPSTSERGSTTGYQEVGRDGEATPPPPASTREEPPGGVNEPPLPVPYAPVEPPLPPVPKHVAPQTSLWMGIKAGWAFPAGDAWLDGRVLPNGAYILESRPFSDLASSGPKTELNVGARLGRHYNVFGHWEYASLGPGRALRDDLGSQERGHMNFIGLGFRFSSDPDDVGVLAEAVMGYRNFTANWADGTELFAEDDFLNTRLSFGADIRISPLLSLSPMIGLSGGFFEDIAWKYNDGSREEAMTEYDRFGQHTVITLDMGAHFDVIRSSR